MRQSRCRRAKHWDRDPTKWSGPNVSLRLTRKSISIGSTAGRSGARTERSPNWWVRKNSVCGSRRSHDSSIAARRTKANVTSLPPKPVSVPRTASAVTIWIYGNNWSWVPDPTTPRVTVSIMLVDREDTTHTLDLAQVGWKEWWLVHKVLPPELLEHQPLRVAGIQVTGAANSEDRELFFEDLAFIWETAAPLVFEPRPQRGIQPLPGQSPGANTGPGRLPFPTREETILPENRASEFSTELEVTVTPGGSPTWMPNTQLEYEVRLRVQAFWQPVAVQLNGTPIARALVEAGPKFAAEPTVDARLIDVQSDRRAASVLLAGEGRWHRGRGPVHRPALAEEPGCRLRLHRRPGHGTGLRSPGRGGEPANCCSCRT